MADRYSDSEGEMQLASSELDRHLNVTISESPRRSYADVTSNPRRIPIPQFSEMVVGRRGRGDPALPIREQVDLPPFRNPPLGAESAEEQRARMAREDDAMIEVNAPRRAERAGGTFIQWPRNRELALQARVDVPPTPQPWWWRDYGHLVSDPFLRVAEVHEAWPTIFR